MNPTSPSSSSRYRPILPRPSSEPQHPSSEPQHPSSEPQHPSSEPQPSPSKKYRPILPRPSSEPQHPSSEPQHLSSEPQHPSSEPQHPSSEPQYPSSEPQHPSSEPQPSPSKKYRPILPRPSSEPQHPSSEPQHLSSEPQHPSSEPQHPSSEPQYPSSEPQHPSSEPQHPSSEPQPSPSKKYRPILPRPSLGLQPIEHATAQTAGSCFWKMSQDVFFPVYPASMNAQFREQINDLLKQLEVNLHNAMTCLSKASSSPLTSNVEIVCTLVAFLGYNFPKTVPLSLLTSPIALAAIKPLSSPLNPEEQARASEDLLLAMNGLNAISTQTMDFIFSGIQMKTLQELNPHPDNCQGAVMSAISRRFFQNRPSNAPEISSLAKFMELCDQDESCKSGTLSKTLLACMISAINAPHDNQSQKLKSALLAEALTELSKAQEFLISQASHCFLRNNLAIATTGASLLEACNQHCKMNLLVPQPLKDLTSWSDAIFCCLARIFLRDKEVIIPIHADRKFFSASLRPYFSHVSGSKWSSGSLKWALLQALQSNPQASEVATSSALPQAPASCLDLKVGFSRFLRSATILNSMLRILFKLDTDRDLSLENITSFQRYVERLIAANPTFKTIQINAIRASSLMCLEQPVSVTSTNQVPLWNKVNYATTLLEEIMCQSLALLSLKGRFPEFLNALTLISTALTIIPEGGTFPIDIVKSTAGHQAFNKAYQLFKTGKLFTRVPTKCEDLQASLNPMCAELIQLSSKICTDLSEEIAPIIPSGSSEELCNQFIETATHRHANMVLAHKNSSAMFSACLKMAASRYSPNQ